jgi:uncharacterized protein (DUF1330 family)
MSSIDRAPAYAIGHITVKDAQKWAAYCAAVPATVAPWHGEVMLRAKTLEVWSGEHAHEQTVVLRFPDAASARGWFHSAAYQALIPLRTEAAEVLLVGFAGPDAA